MRLLVSPTTGGVVNSVVLITLPHLNGGVAILFLSRLLLFWRPQFFPGGNNILRQTGTRDRCLNFVIADGFRVGLQRGGRLQFLENLLLFLLRLLSSFRGKGSRNYGQVLSMFARAACLASSFSLPATANSRSRSVGKQSRGVASVRGWNSQRIT